MSTPILLPGVNATAQWFHGRFPADRWTPPLSVLVLHSTETMGWPGYSMGATAPNTTGRPDFDLRRIDWRAHYLANESSRALRNEAGGVLTNTAHVHQVELVGTCDARVRMEWERDGHVAGRDFVDWNNPPTWVLDELARYVAHAHQLLGIPLRAWPGSGRMSFAQWLDFTGVCGHRHVPENTHVDPGRLDLADVCRRAAAILTPPPAKPPTQPVHPPAEQHEQEDDDMAAKLYKAKSSDHVFTVWLDPTRGMVRKHVTREDYAGAQVAHGQPVVLEGAQEQWLRDLDCVGEDPYLTEQDSAQAAG